MHSIWLSLFVPGMFLLVWSFPWLRQSRLWLGVGGLVLLAIAVLVGVDLQRFVADGGTVANSPKRALFVLISATDYPLGAALFGSLVNLLACRCWQDRREDEQILVEVSTEPNAQLTNSLIARKTE